MPLFLTREFEFNGGHRLRFKDREEPHNHGHNYEFRVTLKGKPDKFGAILDLHELNAIVTEKVVAPLDGRFLNDLIDNPTMERITMWIWERLKPVLPNLHEVRVWENRKKGSGAAYREE